MKQPPKKRNAPAQKETWGESAQAATPGTSFKKWGFRLSAAILAPLIIFVGLEAALALSGYGHPSTFFCRRLIDGQKRLVENQKFALRFFPPSMARTPRAMCIPEAKAPNTCRIFVFGESAAYGDPQPDFGLPRMLEVLLRERYPGARFEVVNAAMTAIDSHVILPIARDCVEHEGDFWVVYMGNNEVIGPYGAGTVFGPQAPSLAFIRGSVAFKAFKVGQLFDRVSRYLRNGKDAALEWGGLLMFVKNQISQDDPRMSFVYRHFQRNLEDMLHLGARRGAKIVVSTVASNLKDCAPFSSLHVTGLSPAKETEWNGLFQTGIEAEKNGKHSEAAAAYAQAGQIDDRFAELQFRWGRCCLAMGQDNEANRHFTLARDYDALRFRADSRINEIVRQTSRNREKEGIYFVDGQEALAQRSPHGLTGAELLYEHVHLNFDGNYWMALEIANRIAGLLPAAIISKAPAGGDWLSSSDCARELAWTDWNRHETAASLLVRLNDPPYLTQLDHEEQLRRLQRQLEALLPAMRPEGLRLAAEFYRRAINRHPDDWSLYVNFSGLQQRLGDNSGAYESWKRVAHLLPHRDAVLCELGLALSRLGRFPEAIEQFEEALRRQPDSLQALNGLGLALSQHGKNQEALLAYRRALKVNPDYFETNLNMGNALKALGKSEEASVQYRTALKHPPNDPGELVVLANICAAQGWNADAIDACERALRLAPFDAMPHLALGGVMAAMGRNSESQQHYSEAVQLKPDLAEAHFKLGLALGRQGLDAQAVARFAEAVRLAPAMIEARLNLGVALLKQKKYQEAAPHFQEALRLNPNSAIARKYLDNIAAIQAKP